MLLGQSHNLTCRLPCAYVALSICWRHCSVLVPTVTAFPVFIFSLAILVLKDSYSCFLMAPVALGLLFTALSWTSLCSTWNLCTSVLDQFPQKQSPRWAFVWFTKEVPSGETGKGVRGQGKGGSPARMLLRKKKKKIWVHRQQPSKTVKELVEHQQEADTQQLHSRHRDRLILSNCILFGEMPTRFSAPYLVHAQGPGRLPLMQNNLSMECWRIAFDPSENAGIGRGQHTAQTLSLTTWLYERNSPGSPWRVAWNVWQSSSSSSPLNPRICSAGRKMEHGWKKYDFLGLGFMASKTFFYGKQLRDIPVGSKIWS